MRPYLVGLLVAVLGLAVVGCGGDDEPAAGPADSDEPLAGKTVWYMDVLNANPALNAIAQGFNQRVAAAGGKVIRSFALNEAGQVDLSVQAQAFDRAIAANPAAIAYFVLDAKSHRPQVQRAQDAGIPVFAAFGEPDGFEVNAYAAPDDCEQGTVLGGALADALPEGASYTEIASTQASPTNETQLDCARNRLEDAGIEFVGNRDAQRNETDIASGGREVMQGILQRFSDLQGLYAFNDDSAIGAIAAIRATGHEGDITIVSRNGTTEAIEAIKQGRLHATCDIDPIAVGQILGDAIVAQVSGDESYSGNARLSTPPAEDCLVTAENVDDYVPWDERIEYTDIEER